MKNYFDLTVSNFKVEFSNFPDGQIGVDLNVDYVDTNEPAQIRSRFSSYQDLFKILALNQVLQDRGHEVELYCPYILGARCDKKFKPGQSFDLRIVAQILNSCNFKWVSVLDPHSDVLPALIERCVVNSAYHWIRLVTFDWSNKLLISPDAGAYKKIFSISENLGCEVISGSKVRVKDRSPKVVIHGDVDGRDCVIIDDICDGGRTFVELGKLLKGMGAKSVTLFVTHGIFSRGIQLENVDSIYTTNSYQPFDETMQTDYFHVQNIF